MECVRWDPIAAWPAEPLWKSNSVLWKSRKLLIIRLLQGVLTEPAILLRGFMVSNY
jgi:hypothetical protein